MLHDKTKQTDPETESTRDGEILLEVSNLKKYFPIEKGLLKRVIGNVKAVDDVSLYIRRGETLGLVGESGSGKTTLGRCVIRAIEPTAGSIRFRFSPDEVIDLVGLDKFELRRRRRHMHMIFQDPYSSLDPRMTVLDIVGEPLRLHGIARGKELEDRVKSVMDVVGLETRHLKRYPHAFSGGQRQRIGIARSIAVNPELVICDEAVSALDVSVQAQILNLLQQLQRDFHLTYLFIAHDLSVVEHIADRIGVMYVGKLVETGTTDDVYSKPMHPYTEALLSAVPRADPSLRDRGRRIRLRGEVADPSDPPAGCYFHPRCRYARELCKNQAPELRQVAPGHSTACHFSEELDLRGVSSVDLAGNSHSS